MKVFYRLFLLVTTCGIILFIKYFFRNYLISPLFAPKNNPKKPKYTAPIIDIPTHHLEIEQNQPLKILFVGDIIMGRSIGVKINKNTDPFQFIEPFFNEQDLIIANLESTLSDKGEPLKSKAFTLKALPVAADYLKKAGISDVSLANNHTKDFGDGALIDTISNLEKANIEYFGAGTNKQKAFLGKIISLNGVNIGFIGFNEIENGWTVSKTGPTSVWMDLPTLKNSIAELKMNADVIVIMPHWGNEYHTRQNNYQIKEGRSLINTGADLIIGNHPHVIQPSEMYRGKNIYYSLGNFIFDGMQGIKYVTSGKILEVEIVGKRISSTKEFVIVIDKQGFPHLAN